MKYEIYLLKELITILGRGPVIGCNKESSLNYFLIISLTADNYEGTEKSSADLIRPWKKKQNFLIVIIVKVLVVVPANFIKFRLLTSDL